MKKFSTADRLNQIMIERNLKQVDILNLCKPYCEKYGVKLEKNDLSQYVSGKTEPKQDKLTILGMGLNVSEVWLMGYDVPINFSSLKLNEISSQSITDEEKELIAIYNDLNPNGQSQLMQQARNLTKIDEYKKGFVLAEQDIG